ncbi:MULTISPECIES: DUF6864 domain-containing function [Vibrio harveyi group]|uniref:DUF6864 domain-containing function n=1 Tax=Vibrio harveyi group TaxID=717610 RepID=UPI0009415FEA|nr:hypothetical protein [Vibrio parahaemolyticus]OKQ15920.1 hypothetical protein H058_20435 [Vibrio antiquarius]MBE3933215.1 hypothetical protein [Vibrio parahaemolyticus]MBE4044178.1 hypothetical protein [Vibrio parahaemolyticus]MCG6440983.1 hypothetical protein [Vibrio parahaemolyticus]MCG6454916.1 hypothetical protein [Vibrio parahaemolyticus]
MKIKSSGYDVVANFDFITFDSGSSELEFQVEDVLFKTHVKFSDNKSISEQSFNFDIEGPSFFFEFVNFNDLLGSGNIEPTLLGDLNGKDLYVRFWISKLGQRGSAKQVKFTFYLGGENVV